jgi:diguanylate cyclase (GGDEF)-like protein
MKLQHWQTSASQVTTMLTGKEHAWSARQNRTAVVTLVSGVAAASLLVLLITWSVFSIISDFKSVATLKARNHEVIATLNRLQIHLTNAEKSERGYLVGSEFSAEPYVKAVDEARWTTDLIHALMSSNSSQRAAAVELDRLVEAKIGTLQYLVEMRDAGSMQSAQLLMSVDQDKLETDRINDMLRKMELHENALLNDALLIRDKAYTKLWIMLAAVTFILFSGAAWHYRGVRRIVQQAAKAQAEMRYLANHDALTGLPNRRLLQENLDRQITSAGKDRQLFAVMYMDLDGFKKVNDTLGHDTGDELLQYVARRLKTTIRASDTVARIGGDEFIIVLPQLHDAHIATHIAGLLVESISRPYTIKGQAVRVSASIGISFYPRNGTTSSELLDLADQALNEAKTSGKNQYRLAPVLSKAASANERRHASNCLIPSGDGV